MENYRNEGQLYSEQYLTKKTPSTDSNAFRARVGYFLDTKISIRDQSEISDSLKLRTGISIDSSSLYEFSYHFEDFFKREDISILLDLITISAQVIKRRNSIVFAQFKAHVDSVFLQENLQYKLDSIGGVHPLIDAEFQNNRESTLLCLNETRFQSARIAYEECFAAITDINPDYKRAIRNIFECAEIIFKDRMRSQNLSKYVVTKVFKDKVLALYLDEMTKNVAVHQIEQFINWVEACHYYRHGQVDPAPNQPPSEIAILLISIGSSSIRWIIDIFDKMEPI